MSARRWMPAAVTVPVLVALVAAAAAPTATTAAAATTSAASTTSTLTTAAATTCPIFPSDNIWKAKVTHLPLAKHSAAYVTSIGRSRAVHPDFGSGTYQGAPFGFPITSVPAGQKTVHVSFHYASESDKGPYPIPTDARIEGGSHASGDRHVIVLDKAACRAYELFDAHKVDSTHWKAGSGAIYNLRSDTLRPRGWTSADAAGLPIISGLVRYKEIEAGRINHAIRMTVPATRARFIWPARHEASDSHSLSLPPMGQRFRLKASVDISHLPRQARIVAQALKTYGAIVADNGSSWYLSGTQDKRWDNDALHALSRLSGKDFEAVSVASLKVSDSSGRTA